MKSVAVSQPWEALRGDPLPWLLDPERPNLQWRVLLELMRRPPDSPAVRRARGGANAAEPVSTLLADLQPDGGWPDDAPYWRAYDGPGWRLLAAVQLGCDPSDPRLQAAVERLVETAPGENGFARVEGGPPVAWLTARALTALAELGWCRHARFQEALAWLEDGAPPATRGGWLAEGVPAGGRECRLTAVALLGALAACPDLRRPDLRSRAVASIMRELAEDARSLRKLGHPCLGRTDLAELLWVLARADVPYSAEMTTALQRLQRKQLPGGQWRREAAQPTTLPISGRLLAGYSSRWMTLRCTVAMMRYAVDAGLPRMYPRKPVPPSHPPGDQCRPPAQ